MIGALNQIEVVTLFVDDPASSRDFYVTVFGLEIVFEDEVSAVMRLGSTMLNVLDATQAGELVEPAAVAGRSSGSRLVFTIRVADVDSVCADLARHGVALLNGPVDRPWGRRTAAFADPDGPVWEVAQELH